MEQDLTCGVCSEVYLEGERDPVLLPHCGHTFCRPCLLSLEKNGTLECPFCRRLHDSLPVLQLPVVFALLGLSKHFQRSKHGICEVHGSLLEFWCRRCRSGLCGHCLFEGHEQRHVVQMGALIEEKRAEAQRVGRQKLSEINNKKKNITEKLNEGLLRLAMLCRESEILNDQVRTTKLAMDDAQSALDVNSVLECLQRLEHSQEMVEDVHCIKSKPCKDYSRGEYEHKAVDQFNMLPRRAGIRRYKTNRSFSLDDRFQSHVDFSFVSAKNAAQSQSSSDSTAGMITSLRLDETDVLSRSQNTPCLSAISSSPKDSSICVNETNYKSDEASPDNETSTPTEEQEGSPSSFLTTKTTEKAQTSPLRCFVRSKDGRHGKMTWEDGRLHVYALSSIQQESHLILQLSVVESVLQESPEVFLDLSVEGRRLGRIYIRLWGHLRRARHFLALCLGALGPSFRGSKFSKVQSKNRPGECLRVSHYLTPEGAMSAKGLMEGLEWGGEHCLPKRAGLVVAASGGKPEYDGCFDICTKDHPAKRFSCPFGEVVGGEEGEGGMEVVREAARIHPLSEVSITEVGIVLESLRSSRV